MRWPGLVCPVVFTLVPAIAVALPVQERTPESTKRQQFNQVFVKVIVPVTSRTPKQDGPLVESWAAKRLKHQGVSEYFAVTDWVPVCDALVEDDIVNNRVWDGRLGGKHRYCSVGGDIPERENGRLLVKVGGWLPTGGCEANIALPDEPGSRAVSPVQILVEGKPMRSEERLPYVAVIIAPPSMGVASQGE